MGFVIHTPDPVTETGATIDYTVRPLFGIPVSWRTLIDQVEAPVRFRDVQAKGPYRSWVHEHRFTPVEGGVRMDDHIEYEMPFGPLGSLAHRLAVRAQLEHLFAFRATAIEQIFEPAGDPTAGPARHHRGRRRHRLRGQRRSPESCGAGAAAWSSSPRAARRPAVSSRMTSSCASPTSAHPDRPPGRPGGRG